MQTNRSCHQCFYLANCKKWQSLATARGCPDYSKGQQQKREQAMVEMKAALNQPTGTTK